MGTLSAIQAVFSEINVNYKINCQCLTSIPSFRIFPYKTAKSKIWIGLMIETKWNTIYGCAGGRAAPDNVGQWKIVYLFMILPQP